MSPAIIALVVLTAVAGTASARNFSISNQSIRASFREVIFRGVFGTTNCQLTLEGSMHWRTIAKIAGQLTGFITAARLGPCAAGTATILQAGLPWHVRFASFSGALPSITSMTRDLVGAAFSTRETGGISCLVRTTATEPARGILTIGAGGVITGAELGGSIRSGAECFGAAGTFTSSRGVVTVLNSTTAVTLTLI